MSETKSILILSPWPSILSMQGGGGTPLAHDLVDTLLTAGYSIDFVGPEEAEADWPSDDARVRIHRYRAPRLAFESSIGRVVTWLERTVRVTFRGLLVGCRRGRPQVVYAFSALTVPAALCCGWLLRRRTVGVLFGTFLFPQLGRRRRLLGHFEEVIAFKAPVDRLIVLNDGTRGDEVAQALGVPRGRLRFWMHGLDLEACTRAMAGNARAELGLPTDAPLVVSASRLVGWKRVDRILRAAPEVLGVKPDALFVLSGDGPDRAVLEQLARKLSIDHAVRFLGALPRDLNLQLIAAADVFCALYDYSCVGVALLEALGCGSAAVVADTGATRDFVEDGANGLVVTPDDTDETAAALTRLLTDDELRARLGREARRRAEERFLTPAQRAALELELINELVS